MQQYFTPGGVQAMIITLMIVLTILATVTMALKKFDHVGLLKVESKIVNVTIAEPYRQDSISSWSVADTTYLDSSRHDPGHR